MTRKGSRCLAIAAAYLLLVSLPCRASQDDVVNEGWQHVAANRDDEAIATFARAVKATPKDPRARRALALMYWQRGLADQAIEQWLEAFELDAGGPWARGHWRCVQSLVEEEYLHKELTRIAKLILESETDDQTFRAFAAYQVAEYYDRLGKLKRTDKAMRKLGCMTEWQLIGPFDNRSKCGFRKQYGPEEKTGLDDSFRDKYGRSIRWWPVRTPPRKGWIHIDRVLDWEPWAVVYALGYVNSEEAQEALFKIGVSGAAKVWLNDALIASEERFRNCDMEEYIVPARLNQGWNKVLVKLCSENSMWNFLCRFTDLSGESLRSLTYSKEVKPYAAASPAPLADTRPVWDGRQKLADFAAAHPDSVEAAIVLAHTYWMNTRSEEAVDLLERCLEKHPDCGVLLYLLAVHCRQLGRDDRSYSLMMKAAQRNPKLVRAQLERAHVYQSRGQLDQAEAVANQVLEVSPGHPSAMNLLARLQAAKGLHVESVKTLEAACEARPRNVSLRQSLATSRQSQQRYADARKELERLLKLDHSQVSARQQLAQELAARGKLRSALREYEELIELEPNNPNYRLDLIQLLRSQQKHDDALQAGLEARVVSPVNRALARTLVELYEEKGDAARAIAACERAVSLAPADIGLRKKLRALKEQAPFATFVPQPNFKELIKNAPEAKKHPEAPAYLILDDVVWVLYAGGAAEAISRQLVKIYNERGIERYKRTFVVAPRGFRLERIEKGEVIKTDGARVQGYIGGDSVVFPKLEPGDVIDTQWRSSLRPTADLANHFWFSRLLSFYLPCGLMRWSLVAPEDVAVKWKAHHGDVTPQVSRKEGRVVTVWQKQNLEPYVHEPDVPHARDVLPWIDFATVPDWRTIVQWYSDLAKGQTRCDEIVKKKVAELTKDAKTEAEKIGAIYSFVAREIKYSYVPFLQSGYVPQEARDVLKNQLGDCKDKAALLIAMLEAIDVKAHFALVNTRVDGFTPYLPSPRFTHCIAVVETKDKLAWVDPTHEDLPFGVLPVSDQGVHALLVKEGQNSLTKLPVDSPTMHKVERFSEYTIDETGALAGTMRGARYGSIAEDFRHYYRTVGDQKIKKEVENGLRATFAGAELLDYEVKDMEDLKAPASFVYRYRVPGYANVDGNLMFLKIPWQDEFGPRNVPMGKDRKYPVQVWTSFRAGCFVQEVKLKLPPGFAPAKPVTPLSLKTKHLRYDASCSWQDGTLLCKRTFVHLSDVIPAADFDEHRSAFEQIVKQDQRQFLFTKAE